MGEVSQCRSCGERIMFIRMKSGKSMPVNPTFVNFKNNPGGKDRIVLPSGDVIVLPSGDVIACDANVSVEDADGYGYVSHFATCPMAGKHRRR